MTADEHWLEASAGRRVARGVLGPALPYLLHLRPAEWPILAAHTAVGWWLAVGLTPLDRPAALALAVWVVALNGGTLALNSAYDRDQGDVAFLRAPPAPPRGLKVFALGLLLFGLGLSWALPPAFRVVYGVCLVMSVAYSVPPLRLKAVAGADWVINMLGYGLLSPYALWIVSGVHLDWVHWLLLGGYAPLFGGLYPLTQLYQMDDDRARGDRTFALRLGARGSLRVSLACVALAFGMYLAAAAGSYWAGRLAPVRWAALVVAGLAWLVVLVPWQRHARAWSSRDHQAAMYQALLAWVLTDVALLLAWAT